MGFIDNDCRKQSSKPIIRIKIFSLGTPKHSRGIQEYSRGMREYSCGIQEYSCCMQEHSRVMQEHSCGMQEYSCGMQEYSRVMQEHSCGMREYSCSIQEYSLVIQEHSRVMLTFSLRRQECSNCYGSNLRNYSWDLSLRRDDKLDGYTFSKSFAELLTKILPSSRMTRLNGMISRKQTHMIIETL